MGLEPCESLSKACQREVREVTGLETVPTGVIGIYSSPGWLLECPDGIRVQAAPVLFEVKVLAGTPRASDDAAELGYFSRAECEGLDVLEMHVERIHDAFDFTDGQAPVLR